MRSNPTYKDYLFVGLQTGLFILYILPISIISIQLPNWLCYFGLFLAIIGAVLSGIALLQLNTNLSPFPTPVLKSKLITQGAFAVSRHPIYTGILAITLGYGMYQQSLFKIIVFCLLLLLFYFKSEYEEQLLTVTFSDYPTYQKRVGKFLPKFRL